jgi:hypothetical protein
MRVYDFVARATDPHSVSQCIEYVVPELTVFGRGTILAERIWLPDQKRFVDQQVYMQDYDPNKQGWVNGAVWTSWHLDLIRDEPCLYVAIGLYDKECLNDIDCIAGHKGYVFKTAPVLQDWQLEAIQEEIGPQPGYSLDNHAEPVLVSMGFTKVDAPLKASST